MNRHRDALALAEAINKREITALATTQATLNQIQQHNRKLNCFTAILADLTIAQAQKIDREIAAGNNPGILAGVPFAVKNLFDVRGITTSAGSKSIEIIYQPPKMLRRFPDSSKQEQYLSVH